MLTQIFFNFRVKGPIFILQLVDPQIISLDKELWNTARAYRAGKDGALFKWDTVTHEKIINLFFGVKFVGRFNLHFTPHYGFSVICEITIIWGDLMEICFTPGWFHCLGRPLSVSPLGDIIVDLQRPGCRDESEMLDLGFWTTHIVHECTGG